MRHSSHVAALTIFSAVTVLVIHGCASGPAPEVSDGTDEAAIGSATLALKPSAAYNDRAGRAENKLKAIEAKLTKVETTKKATKQDADELDKSMLDYAQQLKDALDTAKNDAEEASKSKGAKGNVDSVEAFEDMAKNHEQRTKNVQKRLEKIQERIKKGEIKAEGTPGGSPTGLLDPAIESGMSDMEAAGACMAEPEVGCDGYLSSTVDGPLGEQAEPFLAAACIPPCKAKNWSACLACVIGAGSGALTAWNTFKSCWNSCSCGWTSPLCCLKKAGCLATFVAKLA